MVRYAFLWYSQVRHFLNELQADLSLSNTPHSIQQKDLSPLSWVICVEKMALEFGYDLCAAYEPIARIWYKGNDTIKCRPIAIIDVHLPEIHAISLVHRNIYVITILLTELAVMSMNVLSRATKWWAPARTPAPLMMPKVERFWMKEVRKGERPGAGRPQSRHKVNACFGLFLSIFLYLTCAIPVLFLPFQRVHISR